MRYYVAIDDTDSAEDGQQAPRTGTGNRARQLGAMLAEVTSARSAGITRHQLLVDPAIPYTSHNSAACVVLQIAVEEAPDHDRVVSKIAELAGAFLREHAAPGSDAGLCVAAEPRVNEEVVAWGRQAQREVLSAQAAHELAEPAGIHLSGHTGERIGVIGALAAVGLRHSGADGRFIDLLPGLRQLTGRQTVSALIEAGVERFRTPGREGDLVSLPAAQVLDLGEKWPQPVLLDGKPTLLVQTNSADGALAWRAAPRDVVKQH